MKDLFNYIFTTLGILFLIMLGGLLQDLEHTRECREKGVTGTYVWNLSLSCSVIKDK